MRCCTSLQNVPAVWAHYKLAGTVKWSKVGNHLRGSFSQPTVLFFSPELCSSEGGWWWQQRWDSHSAAFCMSGMQTQQGPPKGDLLRQSCWHPPLLLYIFLPACMRRERGTFHWLLTTTLEVTIFGVYGMFANVWVMTNMLKIFHSTRGSFKGSKGATAAFQETEFFSPKCSLMLSTGIVFLSHPLGSKIPESCPPFAFLSTAHFSGTLYWSAHWYFQTMLCMLGNAFDVARHVGVCVCVCVWKCVSLCSAATSGCLRGLFSQLHLWAE